jgi:tetratricopeptide (TPR) repeat protein
MPHNINQNRFNSSILNELANIQFAQNNVQKAFQIYKQAVKILKEFTKKFTKDDKRALSVYQNNAGKACLNPKEKIWWHQEAIISLDSILHHEFELEDFRHQATYHYNISLICIDPDLQEIWLEKALELIRSTLRKSCHAEDLRQYAFYKTQLGGLSIRMQNWDKAKQSFNDSITAYETIRKEDKKSSDESAILENFAYREKIITFLSHHTRAFSIITHELRNLSNSMLALQGNIDKLKNTIETRKKSSPKSLPSNPHTLFQPNIVQSPSSTNNLPNHFRLDR